MAAQSELEVRIKGRDELSPSFAQLESKVIRFVGAVSSALTALQVIGFPVNAIRTFEKEMANVQKTTGFADGQIKSLGASLVDLSRKINVSAADLASIAAAAGQQGLGREGVAGILQFTASVSRMAAVLDLTVEQAGTDIGKIASIFKIPLRDIEDAVSAFNETSNNSTASGEQLLDVVKRIGDAAGSLDLAQSIGLSATGIDLGLSPEVVGSSFQKVFAEMYGRAEGFSKLLGVSVNDWMQTVQANGIDALKMYLDGLRKLTPEAQQQTIKTLSGGGRIGALVTKLLRDTEDTILDRNVDSATRGITTGTSAIKEQLTVLQTLDAEAVKLGNSIEAIGIKAGERFAGPLGAYLARLNESLSDETVIQFAEAVGDAFLDVFESLANGISYMASLNVNWGNFVQVAKVFLGLKLVQALAGLLGTMPGLNAAWIALAGSATKAADAQIAAGAAGSSGLIKAYQLTKQLLAQQEAVNAAISQETRMREAALAAQRKAVMAATQSQTANAAANSALGSVSSAGSRVSAAKAAVVVAEQQALAAQEALQRTHAARVQQAEQQHAARIVAIEQERVRLQAAARAEGNRSALLAATRARNEQLAAEEAHHARSLTGINSYYARRLQAVQAAGAAEVAASKLSMMQSLSQFDSVVNTTGLSDLQQKAKAASSALEAASANAQAASTQLTLAQRASVAASAAFTSLGAGVRIATAAIGGLLSVASKLFFWLTIIYTALDAFGVIDQLGTSFQKLTDLLGLTSEKTRQAAEDAKAHARQLDAERIAAEEATAALEKLRDVRTGQIAGAEVTRLRLNLETDDLDLYKATLSELVSAATAADAKLEQLGKLKSGLPLDMQKTREELAQAETVLAQYAANVEKQRKRISSGNMLNSIGDPRAVDRAIEAYDAQVAKIEELRKKLSQMGKETLENLNRGLVNGQADAQKLGEILAETFTPESAGIYDKYMGDYAAAMEELERLKIKQEEAAAEAGRAGNEEQAALLKERTETAREEYEKQKLQVAAIQQEMAQEIEALKRTGGLSQAVMGSLDVLPTFFNYTRENILAVGRYLDQLRTRGVALTGALAPPESKPSEGDGSNEQETDAERRRLRRARIDLARTELQTIANLEEEDNERRAAQNEDFFDRSLTSIQNYYQRRREIESSNIDIAMRQARAELDALNDELTQATEDSERIRTQADIARAQGRIELLNSQRRTLEESTDREMANALQDFADNVAAQRAALASYIGAGSDQAAFEIALADAEAGYRDFIQRLRTESENAPELLPLLDAAEFRVKAQAVQEALSHIEASADLSAGSIDLISARLDNLREAGSITTVAYEEGMKRQREALAELRTAEANRKDEMLKEIYDQSKALEDQSLLYKQMAQDVANLRMEAETLRSQSTDTARQINSDMRGSFSELFTDLASGEEVRGAFTDMVVSVASSIRDTASDVLADYAMETVKGMLPGGDGLGGMLSEMLGGQGERGSISNPMYTQSVGVPLEGTKEELTQGVFSEGIGGLKETFGNVGEGLKGALSTGWEFLSQIFMQVGAMIVSALGASSATSSGSGLFAGLASAFTGGGTAAAHWGGVVGRTTMRRTGVHPSVFANAVRYHTGTMGAGLAPNEVPAILEKGETVRTEQQEAALQGALAGADAGGGGDVNVWVVSPDMQPPMGPRDIVAVVSEDIARGGSIRKVIATIPRK